MSLTRVDQRSTNSVRRSSLIVNLSTTKKRSSVTTLLSSGGSSLGSDASLGSTSRSGHYFGPLSLLSSRQRFYQTKDSCMFDESCSGQIVRAPSGAAAADDDGDRDFGQLEARGRQPKSAPATLSKPTYCTRRAASIRSGGGDSRANETLETNSTNDNADTSQVLESYGTEEEHKRRRAREREQERAKDREQQAAADERVGYVERRQTKSEQSSRRNSREDSSPEPIVEVRHTSSSSSSSNSSTNSAASSDEEDSSRKLVRRRTVRRYQRSTIGDGELVKQESQLIELGEGKSAHARTTAELTISIDKSAKPEEAKDEVKSHFRTRQIGSYYTQAKEQQQQRHQTQKTSTSSSSVSHSTSSKVAKCSTITTNRKSTTSHRQLISESSSSSLSSLSTTKASNSKECDEKHDKMVIEAQSLAEPGSSLGHPKSLFDQRAASLGANFGADSLRSIKVKQEEESSVHRESFSSTTSVRDGSVRKAEISSSMAHEASASMSTHSSSNAAGSISTSTARHTSDVASQFSSRISTAELLDESYGRSRNPLAVGADRSRLFNSLAHETGPSSRLFLNPEVMFVTPDVRSLAKDVGTQFAELENFALISTSSSNQLGNPLSRGPSSLSSRLFGNRRLLSAVELEPARARVQEASNSSGSVTQESTSNSCKVSPATSRDSLQQCNSGESYTNEPAGDTRGAKIRALIDKAQAVRPSDLSASPSLSSTNRQDKTGAAFATAHLRLKMAGENQQVEEGPVAPTGTSLHKNRCKAAMSESIQRIDKRMSDLCKRLNECSSTREAIELLNLMIQMIEKAWSVPICGDDLGFKLCASFREAGGLSTLLGFIYDSDEIDRTKMLISADCAGQPELVGAPTTPSSAKTMTNSSPQSERAPELATKQQSSAQMKNNSSSRPLRLNLTSINQEDGARLEPTNAPTTSGSQTKDSDSDILTSDLGLDSASVDSLSYVSASHGSRPDELPTPETGTDRAPAEPKADEAGDAPKVHSVAPEQALVEGSAADERPALGQSELVEKLEGDEMNESLRNEELVFLSARLLSQCLTSENRNFIVDSGLDPVIRLACNLATAKAGAEHNELQASVGTEILQHLFKHSEDTCSQIIALGGLKAVLDGCRSSHVERLRHCASALVNLALYGGPDSQQEMVKREAHNWLFPLAFNEEDDNVQYYGCLAIVVLVANQEIEAAVLKSGTLNLVEPFVTTHEPRRFAESTTAHIHGQSAEWLRKLVPLLESKREEARNLASFHFAMEAYIKREQGQARVFKQIGAVEPLKRVGSSPNAIASKFACQALRLIGEKEPHKLSQQVPLWTSEDVVEWVSQIGFEKFKAAFVESRVDGDLLLQLDNEALRSDIGIENGIVRRRFLRELAQLKRIADYSSVDKTGLSALLGQAGVEFVEYTYPMVQLGVTKDSIHLLDCEQLLNDCRISNAIHKTRLALAIKSLQERMRAEATQSEQNSTDGKDQKTLDVFISYRRSTGSQLASLLKVHLQLRNFSVFIDVERLEAGKFDNNLLDSVRSAKNFILVLSPNALDRCIGDPECKDWVHKEIVAALASNCNIIPIIDNFQWPKGEELPDDMRSIVDFNGVRWYHEYQEACVDKVERFIRGELSESALVGGANGGSQQLAGCGSTSGGSNHSSLQRNLANTSGTCSSTPSPYTTPSLISFPMHNSHRGAQHYDSDHHPLSFASAAVASAANGAQARRH